MLRISRAEEYALRLLMRMARQPGQLTLAELASAEALPEPTIAKLLGRLRDGGLVAAARGRHGGYELALPPERISVAQVLRVLGVPAVSRHSCDSGQWATEPCPRLGDCGLRTVWHHLEERVTHVLDRVLIADLLRAEQGMSAHLAALWPRSDATTAALGTDLKELTLYE